MGTMEGMGAGPKWQLKVQLEPLAETTGCPESSGEEDERTKLHCRRYAPSLICLCFRLLTSFRSVESKALQVTTLPVTCMFLNNI